MVPRVACQPSFPAPVGVDDVEVGVAPGRPRRTSARPATRQVPQTSRVSTRFPLPSASITYSLKGGPGPQHVERLCLMKASFELVVPAGRLDPAAVGDACDVASGTTRCFAASGPAAATDVSVTAATSAAGRACRAFISYLRDSIWSHVESDDRPGSFQIRYRRATAVSVLRREAGAWSSGFWDRSSCAGPGETRPSDSD